MLVSAANRIILGIFSTDAVPPHYMRRHQHPTTRVYHDYQTKVFA